MSVEIWYCENCLITLPMQEIAPIENRKPIRNFFVVDILIFHNTISGTDRRAKSKAIWTTLRAIPIAS